MAVETQTKVTYQLGLNNGVDPDGNTKYVNISLGTMSNADYDSDKALAITATMNAWLSKTISRQLVTRTALVTRA